MNLDELQYKVENFSLYFQGGVRRSVLIFIGISLILLAPLWFAGIWSSILWSRLPVNPGSLDFAQIVIPKVVDGQEFVVSSTQTVPLSNGENDLYIAVDNKNNPNIGFYPWIYTLQVLDSDGRLLSQKRENSYILPGEVKYLTARSPEGLGVSLNLITESGTVARTYNPEANPLLKEPKIEIRQQNIKRLDNQDLEIRMLFANNDQVYIERVNVLYIVRDTRQSVVGISEYFFNGFNPGEERSVVLTYPAPADREAKFLDIRWSVNYLDTNTIQFR